MSGRRDLMRKRDVQGVSSHLMRAMTFKQCILQGTCRDVGGRERGVTLASFSPPPSSHSSHLPMFPIG